MANVCTVTLLVDTQLAVTSSLALALFVFT